MEREREKDLSCWALSDHVVILKTAAVASEAHEAGVLTAMRARTDKV